MCSSDIFLGLIAILFPPVAVWIKTGLCTADSLINLALCCLGYVPGLLHAWYIIAKFPESDSDYEPIVPSRHDRHDPESGRVTYYYVQQPQTSNEEGSNNTTTRPPPPPPAESRPQPQQPLDHAGEGNSENRPPPPSYSEVVRGDHKIQTHA